MFDYNYNYKYKACFFRLRLRLQLERMIFRWLQLQLQLWLQNQFLTVLYVCMFILLPNYEKYDRFILPKKLYLITYLQEGNIYTEYSKIKYQSNIIADIYF